jgi:hypothetical protein
MFPCALLRRQSLVEVGERAGHRRQSLRAQRGAVLGGDVGMVPLLRRSPTHRRNFEHFTVKIVHYGSFFSQDIENLETGVLSLGFIVSPLGTDLVSKHAVLGCRYQYNCSFSFPLLSCLLSLPLPNTCLSLAPKPHPLPFPATFCPPHWEPAADSSFSLSN